MDDFNKLYYVNRQSVISLVKKKNCRDDQMATYITVDGLAVVSRDSNGQFKKKGALS